MGRGVPPLRIRKRREKRKWQRDSKKQARKFVQVHARTGREQAGTVDTISDTTVLEMFAMKKAVWPLRIWGIRHARAMILCYRINRHYDAWQAAGFFGGWTPEEIDYWKDVKEGRA